MSNHQSSGSRGKAIATPPLPAFNCPRCDSSNTKFCYYNNYSLAQPRHFCKACKRYWTQGGSLRNVPVGGGCRKSRKTTRSSSADSMEYSSGASSYSDMGRFKFNDGLDFQLGGGLAKFPSFNKMSTTPTVGSQLVSSSGDIPTLPIAPSSVPNFDLNPNSETNLSQLIAFNTFGQNNDFGSFNEGLIPAMGPTNGNQAFSMESFNSINQDLHWKLQEERMSMMLNGGVGNYYQQQDGMMGTTNHLEGLTQAQKPQPMLFNNLENFSKPADYSRNEVDGSVNVATENLPAEWYFGSSSYAPALNDQLPSRIGNGKGIPGWADFDQYTSLP